jgi:prophage antirepressor-like protein
MNEVQIFNFEGFRGIRVIIRNGEPWFVAKDVCDILDIKNSRDVVAKTLDDDEKGVDTIYTPGGNQEMSIVSESGLYNLIFQSRKPVARLFRRWVTHEVLPAIRKTGRYVTPKKTYTKAEIDKAGREFFMGCFQDGGIERYLEERYPDKYCGPRNRFKRSALLTRQEKRWLEEAEAAGFLAKEGRL